MQIQTYLYSPTSTNTLGLNLKILLFSYIVRSGQINKEGISRRPGSNLINLDSLKKEPFCILKQIKRKNKKNK